MIIYQLRCSNNHEFEAWFRDSAAYDSQAEAGDVVCPHCSDKSISKAIMAPNISPTRSSSDTLRKQKKPDPRGKEITEDVLKSVESLRSHVEANCDDVGTEFAEEARKIHYGEKKKRGIYGEATAKEASELNEEGIEFFRLPGRLRRDS